ncbi:MAG: lamin tail domain-containing protein [Bacteroidota bacterium]|nr:lamin tail domain-containing protein [Bacteroidota bacterium]
MGWSASLLWITISTATVWAQVVIHEVMPVPPTAEPEWVELYNLADTSVDLTNWWIADLRATVRLPQLHLPARGYAVLSRDTTALREARFIPASTILVETRLPTLNNTSDAVILRTPDSLVVDSLYYSMRWGRSGVSLERRWAKHPAWSAENLLPCTAPSGATPGEANSVTPLPSDYCLRELQMADPATLLVVVQNTGTDPQGVASCTVWVDANNDSSFTDEEIRLQHEISGLSPAQHQELRIATNILWSGISEGWHGVQAVVKLPNDIRSWNDTLRGWFYRSAVSPALRINEILYEPAPGGAEFVELVNLSSDTLTLRGWKLHDWAPTRAETLRITAPIAIPPNGFAVIAWDSAIVRAYPQLGGHTGLFIGTAPLALNNAGDAVVLRDPNDVLADSVYYEPDWHDPALGNLHRGISLEKLHPLLPSAERNSWSSCGAPTGATPGAPNSIALASLPQGSLSASPNPFRLSDAERRYCVIGYTVPFRKAVLTIRVFTEDGAPVRTVAHAVYSAAQGYVSWDGRSEYGELVPPAPYVVLLEAYEVGSNRRYLAKLLLVVGR